MSVVCRDRGIFVWENHGKGQLIGFFSFKEFYGRRFNSKALTKALTELFNVASR